METIELQIEMSVEEDIEDLILNLHVKSEEGMGIFSSREPDGENLNRTGDKILIIPTQKGKYRLTASVPAPLLNTGFYELHIALIGPHRMVLDQRRGVYVEIQDLKASFSSCIEQRRSHGDFVPAITWHREPK
jgi:hypothetical protein